ncbi:MLP-like protein 329 [Cucumis melo]|uniref:MLP-like protein 329 n=1 Tax=Cucumis melo TaxID=3656 RepID=A0A1S3BPG4_CUCME|nr:MLP-like protein 329 [Cucumis melo]
MGLVGEVVSEIEVNANADKFFHFFKHEIFHTPNISSKFIQQVELHEGDWDIHSHGSIKIWNYTIDGKAEAFKERVEFDDKKLAMKLVGLEGNVFKHYKTFNITYQIVPKKHQHSLVVLNLKYEKLDGDSPTPYKYVELLENIIKDIESYLK